MSQGNEIQAIKRFIVLVLYVGGSVLTAYNVTAFKGDTYGLYYRDLNQQWLAIGVGLFAAAWAMNNWKRL